MSAEHRKRLKAFHVKVRKIEAQWNARDRSYRPRWPEYPLAMVAGMTCEAKTRAGTPCKLRAIFENGRCKWHGGMSTGPKTEAGKEQARINGRKGGRPKKGVKV